MTDYEEFLVPVEIAKELNGIGFDKPCFFSFNEEVIGEIPLSFGKFLIKCNDHEAHLHGVIYEDKKVTDSYPIPTYEQVFAWFRGKGLYGNIEAGSKYNSIYIFSDNDLDMGSNIYPTYEEAKEELLKRLIEIYRNEKTNI